MNRNLTPRETKAAGARHAHGKILAPNAGALYVHLHRELGLAHRHYVLRPWQVRVLSVVLARPLLVLYVVALALWGWTAQRAARVPSLQRRVTELTSDAKRLDTLTSRLNELQARYEQVQKMLSAVSTGSPARSASAPPKAKVPTPAPRPDSSLAVRRDTTPPVRPDTGGR